MLTEDCSLRFLAELHALQSIILFHSCVHLLMFFLKHKNVIYERNVLTEYDIILTFKDMDFNV